MLSCIVFGKSCFAGLLWSLSVVDAASGSLILNNSPTEAID